jgi:hypothetical protein
LGLLDRRKDIQDFGDELVVFWLRFLRDRTEERRVGLYRRDPNLENR